MGLILSLLVVILFLALGLPTFASGNLLAGSAITVVCLALLAMIVGAYGPWRYQYNSIWQPLKKTMVPYLMVAFVAIACIGSFWDAFTFLTFQECSVPAGKTHAAMRFALRFACENFGYRIYSALLILIGVGLIPLGALLWRLTRNRAAS